MIPKTTPERLTFSPIRYLRCWSRCLFWNCVRRSVPYSKLSWSGGLHG